MLPVVVWLAGLLTAAASEQSDPAVREDALRQRLGLGGKRPLLRHAPMPGGVTIWAWPDGSRIVRLVTMFEVEITIKIFDGIQYDTQAYDAVSVMDDEEVDLSDPDTSVFAYLDINNRARAFMLFSENANLLDLSGLGDNDEIASGEVRSRVYQFLRDHEADEMADEDAKVMWYDDILVPAGLLESLDAIDQRVHEHGFSEDAHSDFFKAVNTDYGRYVRDYVRAYYDLKMAVDQLAMYVGNIEHLERVEPTSKAFLEHLEESGRIDDIVERLDIEEDLIRQALSEGPDAAEALDDARAQGFYPEDEHRMEVQNATEELSWGGILQDLDSAAQNEAEELNLVMSHHGLRRGHASRNDRLRFELYPEGAASYDDPILPDLVHRLSDYYYEPSWIAQGHTADNAKERPGFLRAIQASGYFETARQLYDKAPEEIIWEWPGPAKSPRLEALMMLGTIELDPRMDLGDFLQISYDQGLLTPSQIDYWHKYLASTGRTLRPPMVHP